MSVPVIPDVVVPASLGDYLDVITRAVFQAGVRWSQIAQHWGSYREAFEGFDPRRVAAYDDLDVERVLATPGVLNAARKVRATIANAQALLATATEFGGMDAYVRSWPSYDALAKDFKQRFTFMGDVGGCRVYVRKDLLR